MGIIKKTVKKVKKDVKKTRNSSYDYLLNGKLVKRSPPKRKH